MSQIHPKNLALKIQDMLYINVYIVEINLIKLIDLNLI